MIFTRISAKTIDTRIGPLPTNGSSILCLTVADYLSTDASISNVLSSLLLRIILYMFDDIEEAMPTVIQFIIISHKQLAI